MRILIFICITLWKDFLHKFNTESSSSFTSAAAVYGACQNVPTRPQNKDNQENGREQRCEKSGHQAHFEQCMSKGYK